MNINDIHNNTQSATRANFSLLARGSIMRILEATKEFGLSGNCSKSKNLRAIFTAIRDGEKGNLSNLQEEAAAQEDVAKRKLRGLEGRRRAGVRNLETKGYVYAIWNEHMKFYIGSTYHVRTRAAEHRKMVKQDEFKKYVPYSKLYKGLKRSKQFNFMVLRSFPSLIEARSAELQLIRLLNPQFNMFGQHQYEDEVELVKEGRKRKKGRRNRPIKELREVSDLTLNIKDEFLVLKKNLRSYWQKAESVEEARRRKIRFIPWATLDDRELYRPENYDLLLKELAAKKRLNFGFFNNLSPKLFPEYELWKVAKKVLNAKDRAKMKSRIYQACRKKGIPFLDRIILYFSFEFEKSVLIKTRKELIRCLPPEISCHFQEASIKLRQVMQPRARLLNNASPASKQAIKKVAELVKSPDGMLLPPKWHLRFARKIAVPMNSPLQPSYVSPYLQKALDLVSKRLKIRKIEARKSDVFIGKNEEENRSGELLKYRDERDLVIAQDDKNKNVSYAFPKLIYWSWMYSMMRKDETFKLCRLRNEYLVLKEMHRKISNERRIKKVPHAYFNPKGKCMACACVKPLPHSCARRIVSFAGSFTEKQKNLLRAEGEEIRTFINNHWKIRHVGNQRVLEQLESAKLYWMGKCQKCRAKMRLKDVLSVYDAVSFFEQIKWSSLIEATDAIKTNVNATEGLRKTVENVVKFIRQFRTIKIGDQYYTMGSGAGGPIGSPHSGTMASMVPGFCEHSTNESRSKFMRLYRYEDDVLAFSTLCPKCLEKEIKETYFLHPFGLEQRDSAVEWLQYRVNVELKDGMISMKARERYKDKENQLPRYCEKDKKYVKAVLSSYFKRFKEITWSLTNEKYPKRLKREVREMFKEKD